VISGRFLPIFLPFPTLLFSGGEKERFRTLREPLSGAPADARGEREIDPEPPPEAELGGEKDDAVRSEKMCALA